MGALIIGVAGNPNVGLYGFATDKYVLLSKEFPQKIVEAIEAALGVPAFQVEIAGTPLVGAFVNGNEDCLLAPDIIFDSEAEKLKKAGINFRIIPTRLTCLGNNLLIGPKGAFANPEFSDADIKLIEKALNIPVERKGFLDINAVGSLGAFNHKKLLIHHDLPAKDVRLIERKLGVKVGLGTINMGNPYVKSGIISNKNGFIIGHASGGPEINNVEEVLGYLD
ncbi:MAG: translation initiation factor IF-6 [Candidatus Woesearchaeota archaeon]